MSEILSKTTLAYLSQVVDVIILVAGNQLVTLHTPDKDFEKVFFNNLVTYTQSRRYNSDFASEIERRRNVLQPFFAIEPLDEAMFNELDKSLPDGTDISEKTEKYYVTRYSNIKKECRNDFGPQYHKDTRVVKSGDYNDNEIIMRICEASIKSRISMNCYKAQKNVVSSLKEKKASQEDTETGLKKFSEERVKVYEEKKGAWKTQTVPQSYLAFLFCGDPGNCFTCIAVGLVKKEVDVMVKGRTGRAALRAIQQSGNIKEEKVSTTSKTIADQAFQLKETDIQLKKDYLDQKKLKIKREAAANAKAEIVEFRNLLREVGKEDTDEFKALTQRLIDLLRNNTGYFPSHSPNQSTDEESDADKPGTKKVCT